MWEAPSYQIFARSPISAVTIKVKFSGTCSRNSTLMSLFSEYNCTQSSYDVNDFIIPPTENSAISITTRITEIEHELRACNISTKRNRFYRKYALNNPAQKHSCNNDAQCILPPHYRDEYEKNLTNKTELCWFKLIEKPPKINYQAFDYVLFVKNYVEFTTPNFYLSNINSSVIPKSKIEDCEYDPKENPFCPKFRIIDILERIEDNATEHQSMFTNGSLIEIKINWQCNLDHNSKHCKPQYAFKRLDVRPFSANPFNPGSTFITSNHFFVENDQVLHRIHRNIYNLHIIVSVTGEVGKFDLFQTTTSIGSFVGIFSAGTIACDLVAAFFTNFKRVKYDR